MLLAALLRLWHLDAGWFGVDQARDLAWGELIARGEALPAVGPLMRNRFHLGATYYYFWSLPWLVAKGPLGTYAFAALLGVVAVLLTWWLTRSVAGPGAALAAAAWLAASPVAVIDTRIAWAPAALPPWSALLLLAMAAFLRAPSSGRAALVLFLAALGTQLHLAAAPAALVAAALVVWHARALSPRGFALALAAGALPLLPMLLALREQIAAVAAATPASTDPRARRIGDLLLLVPRLLDGLTLRPRPLAVDAWLRVESVATALPIAASCWLLLRPPPATRGPVLRWSALLLLACVAAVAVLPAEAWYYYLDATLVPGALLVGVAWQQLRPRRLAIGLLLVVLAARTLLILWWVHATAANGFVAANLDFLRLGGARPAAADARARLPDVATKEDVARLLVHDLAIPLERLWRDVHGSGFSDVDTDNGYFLRRAAAARTTAAGEDPRVSALVSYRGDFPAPWLERLGAARTAGALEVRAYRAAVDAARATLVGCGGGPVPQLEPPEPLAYGSGEFARPHWPCAEPEVEVPVAAVASDTALRVLARVDGAGRILDVRADPPGTPLVVGAPGTGVGLELAPGPARLFVRLAVDGPARLDLYELHGVR